MSRTISDYFLPGYIKDALKAARCFRVTDARPLDGVRVRHLEVNDKVLRIIGRQLRARRDELLGQVDLRTGLSERLAGMSQLAARAGDSHSALRREALQILPQISGLSEEMIDILLDSLAQLMGEAARGNGDNGLPPNRAAVEFVGVNGGYARYYSGPTGVSLPRLLASGARLSPRPILPLPITGLPRVVTNIAAGNVPGIALTLSLLSVFAGAASLGKNSSAEPYFGPRFLSELALLEHTEGLFPLSDLMPLVTFRGSRSELLTELIHQGDHVQVTGGHDSKRVINGIVWRLRSKGWRGFKRRVSGHWHKVSFDVISREFLSPQWIDLVARSVAFDNSMFNTQGCLSAQQVFVEGDEADALRFAERYLASMRALLQQLPKGTNPQAGLRDTYQWYEKENGVRILTSLRDMEEHPFFAAYDSRPREFGLYNGLNRSILIRRLDSLERDLPRLLGGGERRDLLQSCGVAIPAERLLGIAERLGKAGVNRIVALGDIWNMQLGSESWDGYLPPSDLIAPQLGYWTTIGFRDVERELCEVEERNRSILH